MNRILRLNSALTKKSLSILNLSKHVQAASYQNYGLNPKCKEDNLLLSKRSFTWSAYRLNSTSTTEKVVGTPEKFEFLAETKQLLNIVAKSLYSDKEVFVRELISNASDAIEKLKYAQLSGDQAAASADQAQIPFEIQISANDMNNTLTIQVCR
jgi:hypothetical protein